MSTGKLSGSGGGGGGGGVVTCDGVASHILLYFSVKSRVLFLRDRFFPDFRRRTRSRLWLLVELLNKRFRSHFPGTRWNFIQAYRHFLFRRFVHLDRSQI